MRINFTNNYNVMRNIPMPYMSRKSIAFGKDSVVLYMIDESGHVSKYDSMNEVSRALGVSVETIKKALEQNKKVSGVILKTEEDMEKSQKSGSN